jgi:beta-lactamase class D
MIVAVDARRLVTLSGGPRPEIWCAAAIALLLEAHLIGFSGPGQGRLPAEGIPTHSCVVILDSASGNTWRSDPKMCAVRLSPASTFKIPHALVALATGVITADTVEKWDGTRYSGTPVWERDHTVMTAMKPSVVWFFQRIAPHVGARRMHEWLERLRYGNARTDGDVTLYWLDGLLQVSPDEQIEFLEKFYSLRLPFNPDLQRRVRGALDQPPGTVENSRGVSRLDGDWPVDARWNAKTGRTEYGSREVSWLVGELASGGRSHIFASAVWRDGGQVDFLDSANLLVKTFIARGLLKSSAVVH